MNLAGSLLMGQLLGRTTGNYLTDSSLNGYGLYGLTGTPYVNFASALQKAAGKKTDLSGGGGCCHGVSACELHEV